MLLTTLKFPFSHTQSTAALKTISVTLVERHLLSILAAQEKIEEITAMTLQQLSTCSFASLISFEFMCINNPFLGRVKITIELRIKPGKLAARKHVHLWGENMMKDAVPRQITGQGNAAMMRE